MINKEFETIDNDNTIIDNGNNNNDNCQNCGHLLVNTLENYVCDNCGLVSYNKINTYDNHNYYEHKDPYLYNDNDSKIAQSSTYVPKGSVSYVVKNGKYVRSDIYKINIQNSYTNKMRSINTSCDEIDALCSNNFHSSIKQTAKELWFLNTKVYKSQLRKEIMSACVYYACIENNNQVEIKELAERLGINISNKGLKIMKEILHNSEKRYLLSKIIDIKIYFNNCINTFGSYVRIDDNVYHKCIKLYDVTKNIPEMINTSNKIICYSVLYFCIKDNVSLNKYSNICNINACTIKKNVDRIENYLLL